MVMKLKENPRLERFLAALALVVIALNFIVCLIVVQVRKKDITKDGVVKKNLQLPVSKDQKITDTSKKQKVK